MSITDELRKWWVLEFPIMDKKLHKDFTAIADRIDAEHERAMADAYLSGTPTDEKLTELGWIRMPKDADGEPIHVGDVMELVSYDEDYRPFIRTVDAVGEQVFFAWSKENGRYAQYEACAYRHHHAPTVEDVLTEFGINWEHESDCEDRAALLKEYATKLQLKEDE